jgi:nitroreductase
MNVKQALLARKSVRAFLDKDVPKEKIVAVLDAARHAPSGTNAQPWKVAVVQGKKRLELADAMENAFLEIRGEGKMDYRYYPVQWKGEYKRRRVETGSQLYRELGIERNDKEARFRQWQINYRAFNAPVILFFFLDRIMQTGSFFDYGMFYQSIMLAALEEGLATCPQAALAQFPDLIRKQLGYGEEMQVVAGMALGYEDPDAKVNNYRTSRIEVEDFTRFFE